MEEEEKEFVVKQEGINSVTESDGKSAMIYTFLCSYQQKGD